MTSHLSAQTGVRQFLDDTSLCRRVVDLHALHYIYRLFHNEWRFDVTGHGADAGGLAYKAVQVRHVYCLRNRELLGRYEQERTKVKGKFQLPIALRETGRPIATSLIRRNFYIDASTEFPTLEPTSKQRCVLEDDEVFLFHGTDSQTVQSIIQNGLSLEHVKRGM